MEAISCSSSVPQLRLDDLIIASQGASNAWCLIIMAQYTGQCEKKNDAIDIVLDGFILFDFMGYCMALQKQGTVCYFFFGKVRDLGYCLRYPSFHQETACLKPFTNMLCMEPKRCT